MYTFKVDDHEVQLEDLDGQDVSGRRLIGTAEGQDFNHCLYLGMRHGQRFVERVKAFKRADAKNGGPYAVSFYE